jgi:hypothetical protein
MHAHGSQRVHEPVSWHRRAALFHSPLHVRPLVNDIQGDHPAFIVPAPAALLVAMLARRRAGVNCHMDAAGQMLWHQLQVVAGLRRLLVRLGQPVPLRTLGVEGVAAAVALAACAANGDDGGALWLGERFRAASAGGPRGCPEVANKGTLRNLDTEHTRNVMGRESLPSTEGRRTLCRY